MVGGGGREGMGNYVPQKQNVPQQCRLGRGGGGRVWDEERLANRMGC